MSGSLYRGRWRALLLALCAPSCRCSSPGKLPHENGWQSSAIERYEAYSETSASEHAEAMRTHVRRGGNLGLALPAYTAALDVDTDLSGGVDWSGPLARDAILAVCDEHPAQTSGKTDTGAVDGRRVGVHVLGAICDRRPYGTHYGSIPITVRGVGNQIVVAPSRHKSGLRYEWLTELPDDPALLPAFDATWFRHVPAATGARVHPLERDRSEESASWHARVAQQWHELIADPEVIFDAGHRHEALLRYAWGRTRAGASSDSIRDELDRFAHERCVPSERFSSVASHHDRRVLEGEIANIIRSCQARWTAWQQTG